MTNHELFRFESKIMPIPQTGCWEWIGTIVNGYGQFRLKNKGVRAHRVSYCAYVSEFNKNQLILHKCDNKTCVNPDHLFLGTHEDNMKDMVIKNRQAKGTNNGRSKLKDNQVIEIRTLYSTREYSQRHLARKYKVTHRNIWQIINKITWNHI